jgi:Flp pilus assembly pilin Flp
MNTQSRFNTKKKQFGQGMTEYIIIVALIAVAAITVYNLFGDTVRGQVGDMAAELGGGEASGEGATAAGEAKGEAAAEYNLGEFKQDEN